MRRARRPFPARFAATTDIRRPTGLVRLTDCLTLRSGADLAEDTAAGRGELLRSLVMLEGTARLRIDIEPRGGAIAERCGPGIRFRVARRPDLDLRLFGTVALAGSGTTFELRSGEQAQFALRWGAGGHSRQFDFFRSLQWTREAWKCWTTKLAYDGPQKAVVRRSIITLKMLDFIQTGALVAAPTSSLPEAIGGVRNWDYRYAWIRDAAFSVYAFRRVGLAADDRGARLAERLGLPGDVDGWRNEAEHVRETILEMAWDSRRRCLSEHLGPGGLDASLLALPLRRVVHARHPKMVATVAAITERLGAGNGLLYRYLPQESQDGLPGHEGAFLLCSFWLVDNLAGQGRLDEAMALYDSLCGRAGALGLLPEEIDPGTGGFLGNYPQAFSHVGVVSSGINLARAVRGQP